LQRAKRSNPQKQSNEKGSFSLLAISSQLFARFDASEAKKLRRKQKLKSKTVKL